MSKLPPELQSLRDKLINGQFLPNEIMLYAWGFDACAAELLPLLEAAQSEALEQARLLGISGERELALMSKVAELEKENAELYEQLRQTGGSARQADRIRDLRIKVQELELIIVDLRTMPRVSN